MSGTVAAIINAMARNNEIGKSVYQNKMRYAKPVKPVVLKEKKEKEVKSIQPPPIFRVIAWNKPLPQTATKVITSDTEMVRLICQVTASTFATVERACDFLRENPHLIVERIIDPMSGVLDGLRKKEVMNFQGGLLVIRIRAAVSIFATGFLSGAALALWACH